MAKEANQSGTETGGHPDHYLAEWRTYRGWTQPELGEMVGVSASKISRIETGETALKTNFLRKLARIFKVPPIALLTINPLGEGEQTAEMLTAWSSLSPRQRADVLRMVSALSSDANSGSAS